MRVTLRLLAATALMLAGCSEEKGSGARPSDTKPKVSAYAGLPADAVLVSVNGEKLTKGALEERISLRKALLRLKKKDAKTEGEYAEKLRNAGLAQFVRETLLASAVAATNRDILEKDRAEKLEEFSRKIAEQPGFVDLQKKLGDRELGALKQEIERQILADRGNAALAAAAAPVTAQDIVKGRAFLERKNAKAKTANAEIYVQATNTWKRLQAGETYVALAERLNESGADKHIFVDEDFCEIKPSAYIEDMKYYAALTNTPRNVITAPFEGDNGLMILKIVGVKPADAKNPEPTYQVQRVFFELAETWPDESDDEIRKQLTEKRRKDALKTGFEKLFKAAKIEYPSGTVKELFPAKSQKAMPSAVRQRLPRGAKMKD